MSDNYLLHKRILVVDDEQALLDMICSILQAYDCFLLGTL